MCRWLPTNLKFPVHRPRLSLDVGNDLFVSPQGFHYFLFGHGFIHSDNRVSGISCVGHILREEHHKSTYSFEEVVQKEDILRLPFRLSSWMTMSSPRRNADDPRLGDRVPLLQQQYLSYMTTTLMYLTNLLGLRLISCPSGGISDDRRLLRR